MPRISKLTSFILIFSTAVIAQVIPANQAMKYVGKQRTVCGEISSSHVASNSPGAPIFVDLDGTYPSQAFTVVVWRKDLPSVGMLPRFGHLCATGLITLYHGHPEITLQSTKDWSVQETKPIPASPLSNDRHYINSSGQTVHSPAFSPGGEPAGATALCRDGTYSFSQHRQGTCSHHGGVAKWL